MVLIINAGLSSASTLQKNQINSALEKLAKLEASSGGRLGLSAVNTADNMHIDYRAAERFPFCSTGKVMVVSAILKKSEKNSAILQKKNMYTQKDVSISGYAPVTKQHIDNGMSVAELCKAAIEYSDNTAMNLLMKIIGGPKAVTSYARSIHDDTFKLDRWEPQLNSAIPGDNRDTTTPFAMVNSLRGLAFGDYLTFAKRKMLLAWLKNNTTGNTKIRAGVPPNWLVGDKTGSGSYGTTNDIAIIWPPKNPPIVMVIFFTKDAKEATPLNEVIVAATRIVVDAFAPIERVKLVRVSNKKLRHEQLSHVYSLSFRLKIKNGVC